MPPLTRDPLGNQAQSPCAEAPSEDTFTLPGAGAVSLDHLAALKERVQALQANADRAFLMLAQELPQNSAAVQAIRDQLVTVADRCDTRAESGAANQAATGLVEFVGHERQVLDGLARQSREGLDAVDVVTQALRRTRDLAHQMKLLAFNAQLAFRGERYTENGLHVLTHELVNLAAASRDHGSAVAALSREIGTCVDEVAGRFARVRRTSEEIAAATPGAVEAAVTALDDNLAKTSQLVGRLLSTIAPVEGGVGAIMLRIQEQDPLRQGVDHVLLVLDEIERVAVAMDRGPAQGPLAAARARLDTLAFVAHGVELSGLLLSDVQDRMDLLLRDVRQEVVSLEAVARELDVLRDTLAESAEVRQQAEAPTKLLGATLSRLESGALGLAECDRSLSRLLARATDLPKELEGLGDVVRALQTVRVMFRIQLAKTGVEGGAHAVVENIDALHASFEGLVARSLDVAEGLGSRLVKLDEQVRVSEREHRDYLAAASPEVSALERDTLADAEAFVAGLSSVVELGAALARGAAAFLRGLDEVERRLAQVGDLADEGRHLAAAATAAHDALVATTGLPPGDPSARTGELIDRFTILTHKEIAAGASDLTVEGEDLGGDLVLF